LCKQQVEGNGVFAIRRQIFIVVVIIIGTMLFTGISYGLWGHNADVKFKLTISKPEDECCCICGTYSTIQEGIDLLRNVQYPKIYNRMDALKEQIEQRITELNALPFGGITLEELQQEYDQYKAKIDVKFYNCIETYGDCIRGLADFYERSSEEEKKQFPNFWKDEHSELWNLHSQLWTKRSSLYTVLSAFWTAGHQKIDYNKK
jgi:hypothetical protein